MSANYEAIAGQLSLSELKDVYNEFAESEITKFRSKEIGSKRVARLLSEKQISITKITKVVSNDTAKKIKSVPPKREQDIPGRKSKFEGGRIYKKLKKNPRREDTHGYKSWEAISDGMTFEQYRDARGRTVDLQWEVNKGRVEVLDNNGRPIY